MMFRTIRWKAVTAASALACIAGLGCAASRDRLVYDNYTQIRSNVHIQADVEAILGEPDQKMADTWIANGVRLAWLIDPLREKAYIYREDGSTETLDDFDHTLSGENVCPGLTLDLSKMRI